MLIKIFSSRKPFIRICEYLCRDEVRAEVLYQEGVRGYDYRLMAEDFETIHSLHPERESVAFHAVLDFNRDERMSNDRMVEISQRYLQEAEYLGRQYVIVRHRDKAHPHVHLLANKIGYDGKYDSSYYVVLNNNRILRQLIGEYQLVPSLRKHLYLTDLNSLKGPMVQQYKIYMALEDSLPLCRNLEELEARLLKYGIDTRYFYQEGSGRRIGISFRMENMAFQGSKIDRAFALPRIEQRLAEQEKLSLWEEEKLSKVPEQGMELWQKQKEEWRQETQKKDQQEKVLPELKKEEKPEEKQEEEIQIRARQQNRLRPY